MSFNRTGYDTTLGVSIVTRPIVRALKEAFIRDMICDVHLDLTTTLDVKPVFVTGRQQSESNIPFFAHPLLVTTDKGVKFLCTDIRPFIRQDEDANYNHVNVRNRTEFNFIKSRTILNLAWLTGAESQVRMSLPLAGTVFSAWLSEVIAKRFALDPKDQMTLFIITHYYYQSLFFTEDHVDEDKLQKFALHTIKASRAPSQMVFEVFDRIEKMRNLEDYCQNIRTISENIRLKDLNVALLVTMIGTSWYGLNAKEILAVALEHPPTWCALVYVALTEKTFQRSMIARVAERYAKNKGSEEYLQSYVNLVKTYIVAEEAPLSLTNFI